MKSSISESVCRGHPDKMADQASDAVLDLCLKVHPNTRAAIETIITRSKIFVAGEIGIVDNNLISKEDIAETVRNTLRPIGHCTKSFNIDNVDIEVRVDSQSEEISAGVFKKNGYTGAGDQGIIFGYADSTTIEKMPLSWVLAKRLLQAITEKTESDFSLGPDGKSQISVDNEGSITSALVSIQHSENLTHTQIETEVRSRAEKIIGKEAINRLIINPSGKFVLGGPGADCGLTGRKNAVDCYGSSCPHGGGALSGKDPTKVDRSAAYAARHAAKNIIAAGLAEKCQVRIAYAIGIKDPLDFEIDLLGTGKVDEEPLKYALLHLLDFSPSGIIERFNLKNPFYHKTALLGHFGMQPEELAYAWEKEDIVSELRNYLGIKNDKNYIAYSTANS